MSTIHLKGAPVPISWYTSRKALGWTYQLLTHEISNNSTSDAVYNWCCRGWWFILRTFTVGSTGSCNRPTSVIVPAVFAGATLCTLWVIVGILVERNWVARVLIAENVTTAPTMVTSCKVGEVFRAGRFIADRGLGIGLKKRLTRHLCGFDKVKERSWCWYARWDVLEARYQPSDQELFAWLDMDYLSIAESKHVISIQVLQHFFCRRLQISRAPQTQNFRVRNLLQRQ